MNTWIVGRVPVAHVKVEPTKATDKQVAKRGEKTFLLKGRIMAGQADLSKNTMGLTDFMWLTKEELQKHLHPYYFRSVRNMFAER